MTATFGKHLALLTFIVGLSGKPEYLFDAGITSIFVLLFVAIGDLALSHD